MSAPHACAWCPATFWNRTLLADHEADHEREERRDYETEGAAARMRGAPLCANPHPARTWPFVEWRRGWLNAGVARKAAA